jgi:hypothetical protein
MENTEHLDSRRVSLGKIDVVPGELASSFVSPYRWPLIAQLAIEPFLARRGNFPGYCVLAANFPKQCGSYLFGLQT